MTIEIDKLVDDVLLYIFDYLDPINWVSIAQGKVSVDLPINISNKFKNSGTIT